MNHLLHENWTLEQRGGGTKEREEGERERRGEGRQRGRDVGKVEQKNWRLKKLNGRTNVSSWFGSILPLT